MTAPSSAPLPSLPWESPCHFLTLLARAHPFPLSNPFSKGDPFASRVSEAHAWPLLWVLTYLCEGFMYMQCPHE